MIFDSNKVRHSTVLYCTYCTVQYCTVYSTVLSTVLHSTVLWIMNEYEGQFYMIFDSNKVGGPVLYCPQYCT